MRLGLNLGYWGQGNDKSSLVLAEEADRLGFSVVWIAEAYGSDAVSVLGNLTARTSRSTWAPRCCRSRRGPRR